MEVRVQEAYDARQSFAYGGICRGKKLYLLPVTRRLAPFSFSPSLRLMLLARTLKACALRTTFRSYSYGLLPTQKSRARNEASEEHESSPKLDTPSLQSPPPPPATTPRPTEAVDPEVARKQRQTEWKRRQRVSGALMRFTKRLTVDSMKAFSTMS